MTRWRWVFGAIVLGMVGCTLFVDTSDLSGGPNAIDAGRDVTVDAPVSVEAATPPVDGGTPGDSGGLDGAMAAPDAAEAGPRVNSCGAVLFGTPIPLSNGSFENGCSNGWGVYAAGSPVEDLAHPSAGAIACRVCFNGVGPDGYFLSGPTGRAPARGESYEVVACVRSVPSFDAGIGVFAELSAPGGGRSGPAIGLTDTYQPVRVGWDIDQSYPSLSLTVRSPTLPGSCFLVDDVSLSLVREAGAP